MFHELRKRGTDGTGPVADSTGNWVDTLAPSLLRPYLRLARADRPIGAWLLLMPCWWSAGLAAVAAGPPLPQPVACGALLRRRIRDARRGLHLERHRRSRSRCEGRAHALASDPLGPGERDARPRSSSPRRRWSGLVILAQFNRFTIWLGVASLAIVAFYPLAKRVTWWPQIVLGLAFSWGALMGWAALFGSLDTPAYLLYAGSIAWVIGYDTIYAHQDREDDALIGVQFDRAAVRRAIRTGDDLLLCARRRADRALGRGGRSRAGFRGRLHLLRRTPRLADRTPRHRRSGSLPAGCSSRTATPG